MVPKSVNGFSLWIMILTVVVLAGLAAAVSGARNAGVTPEQMQDMLGMACLGFLGLLCLAVVILFFATRGRRC